MSFGRYVPWVVVVLAVAGLLIKAAPPADQEGKMRLVEFSQLPVVADGRVKPFDTLARNSLLKISNRQEFYEEREGKSSVKQPAIKWLLDVMAGAKDATKEKVFRIESDQVLGLLDLKPRSGLRYSVDEFADKVGKVVERARAAQNREDKDRDLFDAKILEFAKHLELYTELAQQNVPFAIPPKEPGGTWKPYSEVEAEVQQLAIGRVRERASQEGMDLKKEDRDHQMKLLGMFRAEMAQAFDEVNPAARPYMEMLRYYRDGDVDGFNRSLTDYQTHLTGVPAIDVKRAWTETLFNHFEPFYTCAVMYGIAFLLACLSWMGQTKPLNRAALGLVGVTLIVHTGALLARMFLMGRPMVFVTNLYSSAVFIGWGCVVMSLVLEAIYRNGIGIVAAAVLGVASLIIAHNLATGDTMEMLQAVLDTNFWLSTHVTCVTLGYAATFLAGFLGILFVGLSVLNDVTGARFDKGLFRTLGQITYGIICFATMLSFLGTVLGGIWADVSWGRFWGWDPKENGALLIVMWNALILHARWGGMVKLRGMALLAIFGNVITAWSWFGVNMLGVGLHSYGFMDKAVIVLAAFVGSQLALIGVGLLPLKTWRLLNA